MKVIFRVWIDSLCSSTSRLASADASDAGVLYAVEYPQCVVCQTPPRGRPHSCVCQLLLRRLHGLGGWEDIGGSCQLLADGRISVVGEKADHAGCKDLLSLDVGGALTEGSGVFSTS